MTFSSIKNKPTFITAQAPAPSSPTLLLMTIRWLTLLLENYFYVINVCFLVYKCLILKRKKKKKLGIFIYLSVYLLVLLPPLPQPQTDGTVQ